MTQSKAERQAETLQAQLSDALAREAALQERVRELKEAIKPMLSYIQNAPVSPRSNYEEYAALRDAARLALREDEP